jgi:hypothetical protein
VRDFSVLSDVEFEELVADLLAVELGTPVERFATGRDGGVDLRWRVGGARRRCVGQCKHYARSSWSQLLAAARGEVAHVTNLRPDNYRFITSFDLTTGQKDQLYALFAQWMSGPDDVLGGRDVDGLLTLHEHIERSHPKLWLATGSQLFWATHADLANRAIALRERVSASLPRYVVNRGYTDARARLDEHRVCVIAGVPGIGKTMLAQVLVADAMSLGYEPVDVSADIDEAWASFRDNELQVFLYDDFLGQLSFSERLGKNEDRRLTEFIAKVTGTRTKLLIMTTREYVLQDAKRSYERLSTLDERLHFVLALEDYTRTDRARILYNHLWHAQLSRSAMVEIAAGGYLQIVDHEHYSPRLIEFCTGSAFDTSSVGYLQRFVQTLDHPSRLWQGAFESHLTREQQLLIVTMATMPTPSEVDVVQAAHKSLCERVSVSSNGATFRTALAVLEGTFIRIEQVEGTPAVRFHNPSIREFTLDWLAEDPNLIAALLESASVFDQLQQLHAYATSSSHDSSAEDARDSLRRALELNRDLFAEGLSRTVTSPSAMRKREWVHGQGQVLQQPRSWFEDRLEFALSLPPALRPSLQWLSEQVLFLAERWRAEAGGKVKAVALARRLRGLQSPGFSPELLQEVDDALDRWLPTHLEETEEDWLPYLQRLEEDSGVELSHAQDLAARFESYVRDELWRWSPSPPNLDELLSYANRFELHELVERLEEKIAEDEEREEEAGERVASKPRSALADDRSADDSDQALGQLFARLLQ